MAPSADLAERFLEQLFDATGPAPAVDWDRFRMMQLIPGTAGAPDVNARDQLVARGFVEIAKGSFNAESERRSLSSLRALFEQIVGAQYKVVAFDNPMVGALRQGPTPGAPPNLARLLSAVSDIVTNAEPITIRSDGDVLGERLMTLLFVNGKYVGFLPGRREVAPGAAKA